MALWEALLVFAASLGLSIVSSLVLAANLDRLGARFRMSEALLGIVTAAGADAPEASAAVFALIAGHHEIGVGVVLGSNLYNLAALLGVAAIVARRLDVDRTGSILTLAVGVACALFAALIAFHLLTGAGAAIVVGGVLAVYAVLAGLRPELLGERLSRPARRAIVAAQVRERRLARREEQDELLGRTTTVDLLGVVPALVAVILASIFLVRSARTIGHHAGIPDVVIGTLLLATLTGIPNLVAAIRLARSGRGAALVSESLNSNNANVLIGLALPAAIFTIGSGHGALAAWWLLALSVGSAALLFARRGLRRVDGLAIVGGYVAFVAALLATAL